MTRQIALGAVIAFSVTVLALSVWEPKAVVEVEPAPAVAPAPPASVLQKPFRPTSLRPESINRAIRSPVMMLPIAAVDAGSAAP